MDNLVDYINGQAPAGVLLVLGILGSLVVLGTTIVAMTPSKDDDAWLEAQEKKPVVSALLKFFKSFSPIAKKDAGGVGLAVQPVEAKDSKPSA